MYYILSTTAVTLVNKAQTLVNRLSTMVWILSTRISTLADLLLYCIVGPKHGDEDFISATPMKHQQNVRLNRATEMGLLASDVGGQQTHCTFRINLP
jgi:hypothetical protein